MIVEDDSMMVDSWKILESYKNINYEYLYIGCKKYNDNFKNKFVQW